MSAEVEQFLTSRARFSVLKPPLGYDVGDEVSLVARYYDRHNAAAIWRFRRMSDGRIAELTELADEHTPILRGLEIYLG